MNDQSIMRISRCNEIKNNLDQAILWLYSLDFEAGNLIMVNYRTVENKIDAVLALGLKTGKGKDSFKVISVTKNVLIWGVYFSPDDIPDVSQLDHEEDFLYHDPVLNIWFLINSKNGIRTFNELPNIPQTFINLADGTIWVSNENRKVKRINDIADLYSNEEIDRKIEYARNNPKYVKFEDLTTEQKEQIRGETGKQGDKGEQGKQGLQGEQGIRGYNGSIENFVVLSQEDYDALTYVDPYKFYFTYEDGESPSEDFYAYVVDNVLNIYATISNKTLNLDSEHSSLNGNILEISSTSYSIPTPYFSPIEGTYDGNITVSILCADPDAIIKYTVDRSLPNQNSLTYNGPLSLDSSTTIKAIATKSGFVNSSIAEATYNLIYQETVSNPVFDYESGIYSDPFYVSLYCLTDGATIRYTLDSTEPNETSEIYLAPLFIEDSTTIVRAKSFKGGMNPSSTETRIYKIENIQIVSTPIILPVGGDYNTEQIINITCETEGATIRYTLDGTNPTQESNIYTDSITISESTVVKAKAFKSGMEPSNIKAESYTINEEPPTPPTDDPVVENNILKNLNDATILGNILFLTNPNISVNYNTLIFS
jgi:hypothetical protein